MNDMRDALKKAGLINESDEKRLKHEERVRKKKLGKQGRAEERRAHSDQHKEREAEQKQRVKAAQQGHNEAVADASQGKQTVQDLGRHAIKGGTQGPKRFHYRDHEGYLPYLSLNDETVRRLEDGEYALVQIPDGTRKVVIVPGPIAAAVRDVRPELVLHTGKGRRQG